MSTSKVLTRLAAAAGVVLATLAFAPPAYAEDPIGVSLGGVPSNLTAGSRPDAFSLTVRNNTGQPLDSVKIVFVIRLDGLTPDEVRVFRALGTQELSNTDSGGAVVVTDNTQLDFTSDNKSRFMGYSIQFVSGAPSGKATLTAEAVRSTVLGSASAGINVKGSGVATKTSGPPPTSEPPVSGDPALLIPSGSQVSYPPIQGNAVPLADGSGIPTGLYIMGALLVGVGGAILWLLFRQRPAVAEGAFVTDEYSPVPSLGYPKGRASASTVIPPMGPLPGGPPSNLHPTAPLPTVRVPMMGNPLLARSDPRASNPVASNPVASNPPASNPPVTNPPVTNPPPVDPWAEGPGGARR